MFMSVPSTVAAEWSENSAMNWVKTLDAPPSRPAVPLLEARDLLTAAALPPMLLLSWSLPESVWDVIARSAARAYLLSRPKWHAEQQAHVRRYVGGRLGPGAEARLSLALMTNLRLAQLQVLRCHRPGGWRPALALEGRGHLDAALAKGRGVVLWVAPFVFAPLLTKMALQTAGYSVMQLSRFSHGYSRSIWGARVINGVRTRAEDRFLAERVSIGADGATAGPMRAVVAHLKSNGIVSISMGADGVQTVTVPFLGGEIRLATGAVTLTQKARAPLLPVFTVRRDDGSFAAFVEPPLAPAVGTDHDKTVTATARALASRLESFVMRWPGQLVWHYDVLRLAAGTAAHAAD
jgi:lauroyl/myristoyl acyltransferase